MFFSRSYYGISIDASAVCLVQARIQDGVFSFTKKEKVPLSTSKKADKNSIQAAVEKCKKDIQKKNIPVIVVVPADKLYAAQVRIGKNARSEVQKVLPENIADLSFIQHSLPSVEGKQAAVHAVQTAYAQSIVQDVSAAGCTVYGVTSASCAFATLVPHHTGILVYCDEIGATSISVQMGGIVMDEKILKPKSTPKQCAKEVQILWDEYSDTSLQGVSVCATKKFADTLQKELPEKDVHILAVPKVDMQYSRAALAAIAPKNIWIKIAPSADAV